MRDREGAPDVPGEASRQYRRTSARSDALLTRWLHERTQRLTRLPDDRGTALDVAIAAATGALSLIGLAVQLGAAAERARIAREMHDIVSHNLTVMTGLADGASYAISAPRSALSAMERVSATGRQALVEMRRLLGVLRDEPDAHPLEPQPGLDRLDDLAPASRLPGYP